MDCRSAPFWRAEPTSRSASPAGPRRPASCGARFSIDRAAKRLGRVGHPAPRARRTAAAIVLNGAKIWCTNAHVADFMLVAAKTLDDERQRARHQSVYRREGHAGSRSRPQGRQDGRARRAFLPALPRRRVRRRNRTGSAPRAARLQSRNGGIQYESADRCGARGVASRRARSITRSSSSRIVQAFGQTISDFQGVRWMIADMAMQTEAARQLVYRAASLVDAGVTGASSRRWRRWRSASPPTLR